MTQEPVQFSFGPCTVDAPLLDGSDAIVRLVTPEHAIAVAELFSRYERYSATTDDDEPASRFWDADVITVCLPLLYSMPGLAKAIMGACLRDENGKSPDLSSANTNDLAAFVKLVKADTEAFAGLKELLGNVLGALASA